MARRDTFRRNPYRPRVEPLRVPGARAWDWGDGARLALAGPLAVSPPGPRLPRGLAWAALLALLLALALLPFLGCASPGPRDTRATRGVPACRGR